MIHVIADNEHDLFFGQGVVSHAHTRKPHTHTLSHSLLHTNVLHALTGCSTRSFVSNGLAKKSREWYNDRKKK